jgi:hypothetical protein
MELYSEIALSRKPFRIGRMYIYTFLLRMTHTITSKNTDLSSWDILYSVKYWQRHYINRNWTDTEYWGFFDLRMKNANLFHWHLEVFIRSTDRPMGVWNKPNRIQFLFQKISFANRDHFRNPSGAVTHQCTQCQTHTSRSRSATGGRTPANERIWRIVAN